MKALAEAMGKCAACDGSGLHQLNEPLKVNICTRCHGTGKDRVVQIMSGLHVLTANGRILCQRETSFPKGDVVWTEVT